MENQKDIKEVRDDLLYWLETRKNQCCRGVVIGLSGGKDSTTVAMLAKKVWGGNTLALIMPNGEQSDIDDAIQVATTIGMDYRIVNIRTAMDMLVSSIEMTVGMNYRNELDCIENCPALTDKAKTNIPPRLRMTILYAVAQTLGYQVIGTGNASEEYIGWTTKWGDSAYDFNPIYGLLCTDVIELGKLLAAEFGLDEKYIVKTPADGLTGKSDEDNFGFTYEQLDAYIMDSDAEIPIEVAKKIDEMHKNSRHKRTYVSTP